jgi:NAD(P)-dependent dehydrogenase (short-subunit alcohol dehydrogenase family)
MGTGARILDGQVAVVTGAGSSGPGFGTGKAISCLLARHGANVVLVDKVEGRARGTETLINDEGGTALVIAADLERPENCQLVVDRAVEGFGGIDILVNNAAVAEWADIVSITLEEYQHTIAVNLTAPFLMCKGAIPSMLARGGGSIVNITSIVAMRATGARQPAYAAAKAGLTGLMIDLVDTYSTRGIRVNCIAPGIIKTPMRDAVQAASGRKPEERDLSGRTLLGIEGDAWDVARAVLFLAGPDGRYITGVVLPVDGGTIARTY